MKQLSKILLFVALFAATSSFAQTQKFGHVNSQELISVMPERDSALVLLERHANELEQELQSIQNEFQVKYNEYQQKQATWTAAILEAKTKELQDLDSRIQRYQQTASQEYQQLQQALFQPVIEKANNVIQQIGKEKGLIYIFDTSSGSLPYIDSVQSLDILPLAKAAMNIPADKKPAQMGQQPVQ
jgi:outer membrane protein